MQVLTYPAVFKRRLPLLLACNKADQGARAHTVDFLRRRLEREVAALAMNPSHLSHDAVPDCAGHALIWHGTP